MAHAALKQAPPAWIAVVQQCLKASDSELVAAAVGATRSFGVAPEQSSALSDALERVALDTQRSAELRLEALAAVPGGLNPVRPDLFTFLESSLDANNSVMVRSTTAAVLAKARLHQPQLMSLTDAVRKAGPLELPRLLGAFQSSTNEEIGLRLLGSIKAAPGYSSLRPESVQMCMTNFPERVREESQTLITALKVDGEQQQAHLNELARSLPSGDVRRGQAVFNSQKAACSTCHAIGYLGGNIGPDLTRIGQVRTERDLLESIVYPSASFVRSYEPLLVTTKGGEDYNGVVRKDSPDEIVLATGPGAEVRVSRSDIADVRPGTVSVMPAGLDQILSSQELADLVTFLKNTKW
jgi:putative heme-binding domain-containing protein